MKVTTQIENNPVLKSITLTLTPREAFILGIVFGNMTYTEMKKYAEYGQFICFPPRDVPVSVRGAYTEEDKQFLSNIYDNMMVALQLSNKNL